ncbi:zinc ribbon domain-containing protein [Lipingzhangella rawalii]|uniref:zinc ribbon domain-containing protein n=1 Tax=Lipingzhangella rawalii TaxID=2055835 RepID=UPI0038992ABA
MRSADSSPTGPPGTAAAGRGRPVVRLVENVQRIRGGESQAPLCARTVTCDACGLTLDRDHNAALNLAALAARMAGTGVTGDRDTHVSKARRADRATGTTRSSRQAAAGRAGGDNRASGQKRETVVRTPNSRCGDTVTDLPVGNVRNADIRRRNQ